MGVTLLEQFVSSLNANVFLREFAFSSAELLLEDGHVEVADHLVVLDDHVLAFQLKERDADASGEDSEVEAWFKNKVRKKAVNQLHATLGYLRDHAGTEIENDRGHRIELPPLTREALSALVVFHPPDASSARFPKAYNSSRVGFVHFILDADYFGVCQVLVTPTEIVEYLKFRERILLEFPDQGFTVSEAALVCQFMLERPGPPDERYAYALGALQESKHEWDIRFVTQRLGDQIAFREGDSSETSHYSILAELGKLSRTELRAFKERLTLCLEAVEADRFELPYRFAVPRTDCGFLLFPVQAAHHDRAEGALGNFALASKHELGVSKQIGLAVMKSGEYRDLLWLYAEFPNRPDPEIDRLLEENYPFRKTRDIVIPRYEFDQNIEHLLSDLPDGEK